MESYLKGIVLFNADGEKREVPLKQGVNIIEGDSKTGKSALVEIIDYCLCSSRCTIPKGRITDFTYMYCIIMVINKKTFIIAREKWELGGHMYFERVSVDYEINQLNYDYFSDKKYYSSKEVQKKLEKQLGMTVSNVETEEVKSKKASLRNMVSFLFQHQNLMASKFALFYRFTDYTKRKDTIEQFPIFAGYVDQSYYSKLLKLNRLEAELKVLKKKNESSRKIKDRIKSELYPLVKNYYSLLGLSINKEISLSELKQVARHLPEFDEKQLLNDNGIIERYNEMKSILEQLQQERREKLITINQLKNAGEEGNRYKSILSDLVERTEFSKSNKDEYICPICGGNCNNILEEDEKIKQASKWLDQEIEVTKSYKDEFSEDIRKLEGEVDIISSEICDTQNQIREIENKYINSNELITKRDKVYYAKLKIQLYMDILDDGIIQTKDYDIQEKENEIKLVKNEIDGFDIETKMNKAETNISNNMNKLAKSLDFEEEYKPINLNFKLKSDFDLYLSKSNQKIYLDEMGSGANWVSCHIALFLSFLRFFSTQENSCMPLIMFFDQPSQVYFPTENYKTNEVDIIKMTSDMKAVNNMYTTIFNEINSIYKDTKILPQLIIVDHVHGEDLECEEEFVTYRRRNWRNKNGLI